MGQAKLKVLVVDGDTEVRIRFRQGFDREGFKTLEADSAAEAYRIIGKDDLDTIVIDLKSVGREALELIRFAGERKNPAGIIVLTRSTTVSLAIETMKLGVFDDLLVPVNLDALLACVRAAARARRKRIRQQETPE